jgi:hypothetical protein
MLDPIFGHLLFFGFGLGEETAEIVFEGVGLELRKFPGIEKDAHAGQTNFEGDIVMVDIVAGDHGRFTAGAVDLCDSIHPATGGEIAGVEGLGIFQFVEFGAFPSVEPDAFAGSAAIDRDTLELDGLHESVAFRAIHGLAPPYMMYYKKAYRKRQEGGSEFLGRSNFSGEGERYIQTSVR